MAGLSPGGYICGKLVRCLVIAQCWIVGVALRQPVHCAGATVGGSLMPDHLHDQAGGADLWTGTVQDTASLYHVLR
jgi:hypothetical protein